MSRTFEVGSQVQTPFGKGVVREVRNTGRLLVEVHGRAMVLDAGQVSLSHDPVPSRRARRAAPPPASAPAVAHSVPGTPAELDLHGLTVEDALAVVERTVNDALLAGRLELRIIHGRSGGRIRGALHRWLGGVPSVARFHLDPRNAGVTVVMF